MDSWEYVVEMTEEELESLKKGEQITKSVSGKNVVIKHNPCEDGHSWGKIRLSNEKLIQRCIECGAIKSTRKDTEWIMDVTATEIER